MDFWFLMAGVLLAFIGMLFHGIAGHIKYIGNVEESDLAPLSKSLSWVSWHSFTIFLFVSAVSLAYVAYYPEFAFATYPIIGVNFLGALLFIALGLGGHKALLKMPGAYLMGGTALLAWLAVS